MRLSTQTIEQLEAARHICQVLTPYIRFNQDNPSSEDINALLLGEPQRRAISALIEQFTRLDKKESAQRARLSNNARKGQGVSRPGSGRTIGAKDKRARRRKEKDFIV